MLQNAYLVAKIGADTAENEQHFAEICQPTLSDEGAVVTAMSSAYPDVGAPPVHQALAGYSAVAPPVVPD